MSFDTDIVGLSHGSSRKRGLWAMVRQPRVRLREIAYLTSIDP
jgi:hypothetical protein